MATAKNKKSTAASEKVKTAAATSVKEEQKKVTAKKTVTKAIAAKPEAKKITAAKEPEKITTAKAPEKITAKPEPKKIVAKETVKLETKEAKTTTKPKTAKKAEASTTKKETKVKSAPVKEEKKAEKKPAKKTATKAVKEPAKKAEKKAPAKKAVSNEKTKAYTAFTIDECIHKLQSMSVLHSYEDYAEFLMDEADLKKIEKDIIEGNGLQKATYTFEKDGYDIDLIAVTLQKIADTMDVKALDYKDLKKAMNASVKTKFSDDAEANAAEYLKEFKIAEKLLMIGQRKQIGDSENISKLIGSDVDQFVAHFFDLAYNILPGWQYDDVKFYEDFAYAILSQYMDLYEKYQLRILIDVADLYIKHGDFQHGDECYGYILRDNQIKDYIYYRFASVYETIDFNKAKGLAYESLQYVDGRYMYYQNLIDIINK